MISPQDIRDRARKLWATGRPLRATVATALSAPALDVVMSSAGANLHVHGQSGQPADDAEDDAQPALKPFFPYSIPFRKPTAQEWLDNFAQLRASVAALDAESKAVRGTGYTVTFREYDHQKLGRLRTPERITFDTVEDIAACAGETAALRRFLKIIELVQARESRMIPWLAERPLSALACETLLPQILAVAHYFQSNPRPNRFARELGIRGVDSKFIEDNRTILTEWLDRLLPREAIDESMRGLADRGFERRYGLRFEEPLIRFRWLDRSRAPACISDATIPLSQFSAYAPACDHVIITENKINFLTLPDSLNTLAIFGGGYAIEMLRAVPWLLSQPLHYWGDLDTHGFGILSRLRMHFPHARSFLMDRDTLMDHRDLWTEELSSTRVLSDITGLDPNEQTLYDDLRYDRLGDRVRLEQERVGYARVAEEIIGLRR